MTAPTVPVIPVVSPSVPVVPLTSPTSPSIQGPPGPAGPVGPPGPQGIPGAGVPAGGVAGDVLTKNSTTDYDTIWQVPGGLTLPLTQNLTFSPDSTYDIGVAAASRPRDLYLGRNATVSGTLTLSADPTAALQAATKQYADTKLTQTQADARYPLKTDPDPYPTYLTQSEGDARYLQLSGGTLTGTLTLAADPSTNLQAATKQYADTKQTQAQADARYLQLTGGTLTGNLLFSADNTRDIGASGATRPRDLFLGRNATIGGTLGVTGATTLAGLGATTITASGLITAQASVSVTGGAITGSGSVPTGGTAGQVLTKNSATNYDLAWTTAGGGVTWPLLAPNGSVSAPSYSFSASTGTGMYSPTTNQVALSAGSTQVLQATSTTLQIPIAASLSSTLGVTGTSTFAATIHGGNATFSPDNTYDIGATGANRPRNLYLAGALSVAGTSQFTGFMALGVSPTTTIAFGIQTSGFAGVTETGISCVPTFASAATGQGRVFYGQLVTAAAAFTMTSGYGLQIAVPSFGASSAVSTLYGIRVENQGAAAVTNAYGIHIAAQSGAATTNIGLYNAGTTQLVGPVTLPSQTVTNDNLAADVARANLLTNGSLDIWQRGNGPFTSNGAYCADRWLLYIPAGTVSISRDSANADGTGYCAAVTSTAPGTGNGIYQVLDFGSDTLQLRNKTVQISVRVKCSQASSVRVGLFGDKATTLPSTWSAYHSGGGAYETLTSSIAIGASATGLTVWVLGQVAGSWYLDNVMLVVGTVPANYAPMHPADDLTRCLRYYQVLGPNATASLEVSAYAGAGGTPSETFQYDPKAVIPTVTKVGTWPVANCSQPTIAGPDTDSCYLTITVTAAGIGNTWNGNAGNKITVEANP
jgi:hypothetical protein